MLGGDAGQRRPPSRTADIRPCTSVCRYVPVVSLGAQPVGSDVAAFIEHTRDAVELGQDQAVVITADGYATGAA